MTAGGLQLQDLAGAPGNYKTQMEKSEEKSHWGEQGNDGINPVSKPSPWVWLVGNSESGQHVAAPKFKPNRRKTIRRQVRGTETFLH